jgi:hypothetical protein
MSGGEHVYLRHPMDMVVSNSESLLTHGVDVRGTGGFVVVPPSTYGGNHYSWWFNPWSYPVAMAPGWLLDLVEKKPRPEIVTPPKRAFSGALSDAALRMLRRVAWWVGAAPNGQRTSRVFAAARWFGGYQTGGLLPYGPLVEQALLSAAVRLASEDGVTEVLRHINNGLEIERKHPRYEL